MDHLKQAADIRSGYDKELARVEANGDLTDEAKQRMRDQLWEKADYTLQDLRIREREDEQTELDRLRRRAFGPRFDPTMTDAGRQQRRADWRAVLDRADQLDTPGAARNLLARARDTEDHLLSRAIGYRAAGANAPEWQGVLNDWMAGASESDRRPVKELLEAVATSNDRVRRLTRNIAMRAPDRPSQRTPA